MFLTNSVFAQESSLRSQLEQGLGYRPIQSDVEIDLPTEQDAKQCEIKVSDDKRGLIILSPQKNTLRVFSDANGDGRVDQWSYFQNGVEVYRDIDSNGNGKADQYRWLNSAGTRWGIDANEDKVIDHWKEISAEEVSREIVLALAGNDVARFLRVALNEEELKGLALGESLNHAVTQKVSALKTGFAAAVQVVALKGGDAVEWYQLNAVLPGVVPSGDRGNQKDIVVYENAMATAGDSEKTVQIAVGTLVKISDNNWRVLDLPKIYDENQLSYTFIQPAAAQTSSGSASNEVVALMNEYQEIQLQIAKLPADQRPAKHKEVIGRIIQIIAKVSTEEERENWIRQLADTIMDATSRNEFPDGSEQMEALFKTVNKRGNEELAAHVRSRQIMTDYYLSMQAGGDDMRAYSKWLENLETMATEFEKTEAGIEGMMQLAIYREMSARSAEEPLKWYTKVAQLAAGKPLGEKAKGAIRRLTSAGKEIPFQTTDVFGKPFDIASLKGKFVLLCFWDASTIPHLALIKSVTDKFSDAGLQPIGVNLDADPQIMKTSVAKAAVSWTQLYTPGGLESSIAVYWGISTPPCMILYGKDGKVIQPSIQSADELQQIMTDATK
ncbi:MAG: TlpA family protein disulfide reductase [Planctomycetaceae bacterium]|nr:TlpA family protein disulfide reductase [Planctomycetaceae bacterium]